MEDKDSKDKTVYVCLASEPTVSEEEVKRLLEEAGVDGAIVIIDELEEVAFTPDDAVILVLEDGDSDPQQAECAFKAIQAGVCAVVGVWSPGQTEEGIPLATIRYGTAQVPWEPVKVGAALQGAGACEFETPAGKASTPLVITPNKCGG